MTTCATCGHAVGAASRFCSECGSVLAGASAPVHEERRVPTVLFADLVGFTARAETLDPEDVRAFLHPYYALLEREITGHGGVVERHLGDGVMALFGAPAAHEDDPARAVRSALAILTRLPTLGLDLHARIGINTGPALFASSGPGREDAVTGDAVNTAARLQAAAPVDGVVVGEATYRATAHLFRWEELEPIAAKGKAGPVLAWRPIGVIARAAGELQAETTPFVGRAFELETLVRLFERSRSTPSLEVVTIVADPGIGKSRLVRELARYVDALPELVTWRVGRCLPYGDGISFWALGEIVKAHAGILETDDQVTLSAKLDAVLTEPDLHLRAWMKDRLGPLVGLQVSSEPPKQEEAFTAWRRFLEAIARAGPTVLIVEDLHWADDAMVAFLGHLLANTAGLPILLVVTARPEVEERHPTWLDRAGRSTVLSLDALGDRDMTVLVDATLPGASAELLAAVLERAAGSPLYAEQLAAMFRDRLLPAARSPLDEIWIPPSIAALLAARIDALQPEAKAVLLDASVVGKTFWSGAVAALGNRGRADLEPVLAELARRELVRPVFPSTMAGEAEYTFVHALLRDVAYGELTRSARLSRHRATAAWITDQGGEALGEDAEIIVAHLERALELATVSQAIGEAREIQVGLVDALLVAADNATRTDFVRAVAIQRRVLDLLDARAARRPAVLASLGRELTELEELPDAVSAFDEARRLYLTAGRDVEAALLAQSESRALILVGRAEVADRIFGEAGEVFRRHRGPALAAYLADAAQAAWTLARPDEALRLAGEAFSLAEELQLPPPPRALMARGAIRFDRSDRDGGEADLREAIRSAGATGDTTTALVAMDNLANLVAWYSIPDALATIEEEVAVSRAHGLPSPWAEFGRFVYLYSNGSWDEALGGAISHQQHAEARGNAYLHLYATWLRVAIEFERGDCRGDPEALAAQARSFGRPYALSVLHPLAARLACAQGRQGLAAGFLEEMTAAFEPGQLTEGFEAARAAAEAGRPDLARRLRAVTGELAMRTGLPDAIVAEAEGDHAAARQWYDHSVRVAATVGNVPAHAYALGGLGRSLLALGETEDGVARLRESRDIWERLRATPRIAEIDALLTSTGAVPPTGTEPA
jgi:class 3 adenylate cyclase/tetratricopeptide (TPR) repeat protein